MRYRNHLPNVGRFTDRDPFGYVSGINLYAMVGNRVANLVDPLGLESKEFGDYPCKCRHEDVNKAIDEYNRKAAKESDNNLHSVPLNIRADSTGREWGGRICCNPKTKQVGGTGPVHGPWKKTLSAWGGDTVDPKSAPACSTLGEGYQDAAYYHSHPTGSEQFSDDDIAWIHLPATPTKQNPNGGGGGLPLGLGTTSGKSFIATAKFGKKTGNADVPGFKGATASTINPNGSLTVNPSAIPQWFR